jgi:hypothetical protein
MATGKTKRRAKRIWKHQREVKAVFLSRVRERLLNDVGPYFDLAHRIHRRTGRGVGFWASARMVFPVVEGVATVIYRSRAKGKPPVRLLEKLGIKFPNLAWEMYRHTLMHNDEMASAAYRGRTVRWGITLGGGHSWPKGRLRIDTKKLYVDLLKFLEREIMSSHKNNAHVWVKDSFRFNTAFARATRNEALRLGR